MDDLTISVDSIVMLDSIDENNSNNYYSTFNLASNIHPRLDAFKKNINFKSNQEERRRQMLLDQKRKRQNLIDTNRIEVANKESHSKINNASTSAVKPYKKHFIYNLQYANQLMYSEWLEEPPCDLDVNWILTICPVGKRCLVVAKEGYTCAYNKAGKLISKHTSKLPGGNKESKIDETILDCIYNDVLRTYFVIDCITWKSHPIIESEAEFRFYWLKCKLDECCGINEVSYENPYVFRDIPRLSDISVSSVLKIFETPLQFQIDGVLFFHKEANYRPGFTPLVGWLKAYMLPEILNIPMPDWIMKTAPSDYISIKDTIFNSNQQLLKLKDYLNNVNKTNLLNTENSETRIDTTDTINDVDENCIIRTNSNLISEM